MPITLQRVRLAALCALTLTSVPARLLSAQAPQPTTHNLTFSNAAETIDANGRVVVVANVQGDLPGVLTLALTLDASGNITGGEWALNVSYIQLGPVDNDGDGDASESLVQLGVIKGSVTGGAAGLTGSGIASALNAVQLNVTGATVQFAGTTSGSGAIVGNNLDQQTASSGSLNLTF